METWIRHPSEDVLEEYALRRLGEAETSPVEEHLLVCETCRTKLQELDSFILAMKTMEPEPQAESASRWAWWANLRGWRALSPGRAVLAGAIAALCAVAIVERPRTPDGPPVAVTLRALRGGDPGYSATAPAGRPLALAIEVPDIAQCSQCRVQMVNAAGRTAWSGSAAINGGRLLITAPVALSSGIYWVRLYTTGGTEPAREFGLRLE